MFGSTSTNTFGPSSDNIFGSQSNFGQTNPNPFGGASSSPFNGSSIFGQNTGTFNGFGSNDLFNNMSSIPGLGRSSTFTFGVSRTPTTGPSSTPAFGISSSPALAASSSPAFGSSSSLAFVFGSTPAFGRAVSSGCLTTQAKFGKTGKKCVSRKAAYGRTQHEEQSNAKVESINAMPLFKDTSHEELRWDDYQRGGPSAPSSPFGTNQSNPFDTAQSSLFGTTQSNPFGTTSSNPFGTNQSSPFGTIQSNLFSTNPSSPFGTKQSSPFGTNESNKFGTDQSSPFGGNMSQSNPFGGNMSQSNPFGANTSQSSPFVTNQVSPFGTNQVSAFGMNQSTPFVANAVFSQNKSKPKSFASTSQSSPNPNPNPNPNSLSSTSQSSPNPDPNPYPNSFSSPLQSNSSTLTTQSNQNPNPFSLSTQTNPSPNPFSYTNESLNPFSSTTLSNLSPNPVPSTTQSNPNSNLFSSTTCSNQNPSPFGSMGFGSIFCTSSTSCTFGSSSTSTTSSKPSPLGSSTALIQSSTNTLSTGLVQSTATPGPLANPFGMLASVSQLFKENFGTCSAVQYGISSLMVAEKPGQCRVSLSVPRHLSQRRVRLPLRKYHPKCDAPKVAFYAEKEEALYMPKADAFLVERENHRRVRIICPVINNDTEWPSESEIPTDTEELDSTDPIIQQDVEQPDSPPMSPPFQDDDQDDSDLNLDENDENTPPSPCREETRKWSNYNTQKGLQAAIVYEHGAEIEALMPKLQHADYYISPRIQDLAARERAQPGFCSRVPDFTVGRTGFGSIKLLGETDVRKLDLESIVQFNRKEVVVYKDEKRKPGVGVGLNKAAEVVLLNIKCVGRKSGERVVEGRRVDKYREMLIKKTQALGGEFLSFDPIKGEWRFRVNHF